MNERPYYGGLEIEEAAVIMRMTAKSAHNLQRRAIRRLWREWRRLRVRLDQ